MKNKIYENNLKALKKEDDLWYDYIKNKEYKDSDRYKEQEKLKYSEEESYTKETITKVICKNGEYYLAGKYSPLGAAKKNAEKLKELGFGGVIVQVGFADGRMLREILNEKDKDAILVVYEPSLYLFLHTLKTYDVSDILERDDFVLIVDGINDDEVDAILGGTITVDNMTKLTPVIHGNYEQIFPEQVKEFVGKLKKRVSAIRFYWNTMIEFTNETIVNNIKNFKYVYKHYSFNQLYDILPEDIPVIVVAAGPSLDINIDKLKEAQGKACIIACDTALKPLLNRGIRPDMFVVVDPRKPLELFDHPEVENIPLISGLNVPPKFMDNHKGKKILYFDMGYMLELFKYVFGDEVNSPKNRVWPVASGGSVATSAFSIGRLMGAKNIILIGQDLALSGEKEHASGTFKRDKDFKGHRDKLPKVEGINGEMIPTLYNLKKYLEWYEEVIEENKETIKVIDATEGGALIHGSEVMTLEEAIKTYCKGKIDVEKLLDDMDTHFSKEEQEKALKFFEKIPDELEGIKKKVIETNQLYKKLEKLASKKNYNLDQIKKVLKKLKKNNDFLDKDVLADMIMDGLKGVEYTLRLSTYQFKDDEQKNLIESARMGQAMLTGMEVAIEEIAPIIKELGEFKGEY